MRAYAYIMIFLLLIQQVNGEEGLSLDMYTIPDKLVSNSNAILVIHYREEGYKPPFTPEIDDILSSDTTIIRIDKETIRRIGNNIVVDLTILNSGNAVITVIPKSSKPISKTFQVYESIDEPSKLLMKVIPSSFSNLGPYEGYISVQLVNAKDMPVKAEDDYIIRLSSSNPNIISLDDLVIKKGEYFAFKKFTINDYGEATLQARYNDLLAETKVSIEKPTTNLMLYIAPNIVPAVKGQIVYAFVQLQDGNGNPIYARDDIQVDIKSNVDDIITFPAIIRRGENMGYAKLIINTDIACKDAKPCIELYAVADSMKSKSAFLELREAVSYDYIHSNDPKLSIVPMFFPSDMKIIADGREKVVGVLQLMAKDSDTSIKPVIPMHSINININSKGLIDIRSITIDKPYSTALVKAKTGYLAGKAEIELFGEHVDSYTSNLILYGHENLEMVAEPLIDKVAKGMNFPYVIYFKDSKGNAAYALDDLSILVSSDKDIISVESKPLKKGNASILLNSLALDKGEVNLEFRAISSKNDMIATSLLDIMGEVDDILELHLADKVLKNTKDLASIELLDSNGYPILAENDITIYIYTSNRLINIPREVFIAEGKHYTLLPLEAYNETGNVFITIFADGFEPLSKSIEVIDDNLRLVLTLDGEAKLNEHLTITLNASYNGYPLNRTGVEWEHTKGLLVEYDPYTNNGIAKAKYLISEEGEHLFKATIRYNDIEKSTRLSIEIKNHTIPINTANNHTSLSENVLNDKEQDVSSIFSNSSLPIDIKYLLIIPAAVGIILTILKRKRV